MKKKETALPQTSALFPMTGHHVFLDNQNVITTAIDRLVDMQASGK